MNILYFDVASHHGLMACCDEHTVLAAHACEERLSDADILPVIQNLLQQSQWTFTSLTHIACVIGPGGFTSLRVGAACANVLSHQLHLPIAGLHLSDIYFHRLHAMQASPDCIWVHSTRKTALFIRGSGVFASQWPEPTLMTLETFRSTVASGTRWMGELIPEHRSVADEMGCIEHVFPSVSASLPSMLAQAQYGQPPVLPWYGRGVL